jgi:hypothetical protein
MWLCLFRLASANHRVIRVRFPLPPPCRHPRLDRLDAARCRALFSGESRALIHRGSGLFHAGRNCSMRKLGRILQLLLSRREFSLYDFSLERIGLCFCFAISALYHFSDTRLALIVFPNRCLWTSGFVEFAPSRSDSYYRFWDWLPGLISDRTPGLQETIVRLFGSGILLFSPLR